MAHAELVLAAGWVGGATTLAMEGIGGVTAMAAGMAERAGVGWEGGAADVRREGRGWEASWEGGGPTCWGCCSVPWLGIVSIAAATDGTRLMWISGLVFTLPKSLEIKCLQSWAVIKDQEILQKSIRSMWILHTLQDEVNLMHFWCVHRFWGLWSHWADLGSGSS